MSSLTPVFERVATSEGDILYVICDADRDLLEQFVVALYRSTFDSDKVNVAFHDMHM